MDDLTKEQQRFIVALYKEYLDRKATMANEKAKIFPMLLIFKSISFQRITLMKYVLFAVPFVNTGT